VASLPSSPSSGESALLIVSVDVVDVGGDDEIAVVASSGKSVLLIVAVVVVDVGGDDVEIVAVGTIFVGFVDISGFKIEDC